MVNHKEIDKKIRIPEEQSGLLLNRFCGIFNTLNLTIFSSWQMQLMRIRLRFW